MVKINTEIIPEIISSWSITRDFNGDIPKIIVVGMVKNTAYSGKKSLNPFNFEHFNLQYFNAKINSVPLIAQPFQFNFPKKEYAAAYWNLMQSLGYAGHDDSCDITRNEYDNGYFLQGFNTSATLCTGGIVSDPTQRGKVNFELKFSRNTAEAITVIMMSEYDKSFAINTGNKAITNFDG